MTDPLNNNSRQEYLRQEYISRINRVIDFIEANLDQELSLAGWMPASGYQPGDRLCYEIMNNNPKEHPEGKHIVDICVPVKPL